MIERTLARLILGQEEADPLMTDGYKFSMAQAGFPLREETFVFSCRKGEPLYVNFDLEQVVLGLIPQHLPDGKQSGFLQANGYGLTPAMEKALMGHVKIWCAPQYSWVLPGEPILTITGPSFLVSWLEPLVIMLRFPLQIATAVKTKDRRLELYSASCHTEAQIAAMVGNMPEPRVDSDYAAHVRRKAGEITRYLGDGGRAFEVGMRAATCMDQHLIALRSCRREGLLKTSNVFLAWKLYMIPVGTTGHEHQMRWSVHGGGDLPGFRAIRDMRREPPSYLYDTYDPIRVGIPSIIKIANESFGPYSIRFDSGNHEEQLRMFAKEETLAFGGTLIKPNYIFEDGYNWERMNQMDILATTGYGISPQRVFFGFGGYLVNHGPFLRDDVSAAYKLSKTGGKAVMKFSGSPGKESLPGLPIILRNKDGDSMVAQEGEYYRAEEWDDPTEFSIEAPPTGKRCFSRDTMVLQRMAEFARKLAIKKMGGEDASPEGENPISEHGSCDQ